MVTITIKPPTFWNTCEVPRKTQGVSPEKKTGPLTYGNVIRIPKNEHPGEHLRVRLKMGSIENFGWEPNDSWVDFGVRILLSGKPMPGCWFANTICECTNLPCRIEDNHNTPSFRKLIWWESDDFSTQLQNGNCTWEVNQCIYNVYNYAHVSVYMYNQL